MKWALVLSGGGALGLAYIGFFKALEKLGYPKPDCIVGCSAGSIAGALYALGMPVQQMEAVFSHSFDINRYVGSGHEMHIPILKDVFRNFIQYGTLLTHMITGNGADSGDKVYKLFMELSGCKSFEDCTIPFFCNALDLCSGKEVVLESGLLADAMRASSSYPGLFTPVKRDSAVLIDACSIDNTPVCIARRKGYKNILALTFGPPVPMNMSELNSSLAVLIRTLHCTSAQIALTPEDYPSAFISFENQRKANDFKEPEKQIAFGYQRTVDKKELLQAFFSTGIRGRIRRAVLSQKTKKEYMI